MIQGSTYRVRFEVPFDARKAKEIEISFSQRDKVVLKKYKKDCEIAVNVIVCWVSAEESMQFRDEMAYAQLMARNDEGAWVSMLRKIPVFENLG